MCKRIQHAYPRHVRIQNQTTLFWRYQNFDAGFLSTIEAIYWFYRELEQALYPDQAYGGQVDDLLFYFKMQWELIQEFYKARPEITFCRRKMDASTYIKYEGGKDSQEISTREE